MVCENDNELSDSIKSKKFRNHLNNYDVLKKESYSVFKVTV